jgi:CDGSH-type Zn-finger protein
MEGSAMADPIVAQKSPYGVAVEAGKEYWWCSCGRSKGQPFCDGSHKGTGLAPQMYKAEKSETVWFCGCKATKGQPMCDGTHNRL